MGTSLTGLTPSTTYDALIKVGDNGPLSGTQKRLSDGLGNDSAMSLSTLGVRVDGSALFEQSSASVAMTVSSGWGGGFDNPIMNFGRIGLAVNGQLGYDDPNTLLYIGTTTSHAFSIRTSNTERIRITPAGNVGIGTTTPSSLLEIRNASFPEFRVNDGTITYQMYGSTGSGEFVQGTVTNHASIFRTNSVERIRITPAGNVGIGTSSPISTLDVRTASTINAVVATFLNPSSANNTTKGASISLGLSDTVGTIKDVAFLRAVPGNANVTVGSLAIDVRKVDGTPTEIARFTPDGLTFNGDTSASNALDDYEEGTFTLSAVPATSGTISLSTSSARYTKIGRQVFVQAFITVASVSLPIGTAILLQGLPFTIANATNAGGSSLVVWADANASYVKTGLPGFYLGNTTQIYAPINASLVEANDEFFITMTYTV
jgi:hypothetical protein